MSSLFHLLLLGSPDKARTTARETLTKFNSLCGNEVNPYFLTLSQQALKRGVHSIRVYTVFCWVIFSKTARLLAFTDETEAVAKKFNRILGRSLLRMLHGLSISNGKTYNAMHANTAVLRKLGFFVLQMTEVFCLL